MNTALESAVVSYLTTKMSADASLSGVTYEVKPIVSADPQKKDRHEIYVRVSGTPRTLTALAEAEVEIFVITPVDVDGVTISDHSLLEQAVSRAWDKSEHATAAADLSTLITANLSGHVGGDFFVNGWQAGTEETSFNPVFSVKVGVVQS